MSSGVHVPISHFQGWNDPVLIHKTPYERNPEVIGLELPIDHMTDIMMACSRYVKNMDMESRNAGTIQASLNPSRKRTTKSDAKLLQGICSNVIPPLSMSISQLVYELSMKKASLYIPYYEIPS